MCDKDGCDLNPFRMGNETFYGRGPSFTVDTTKPMTVVTQFLTNDGTDEGDLVEIRFYLQDGKTIHSPPSKILGPSGNESITDNFCKHTKHLFGDIDDFAAKGGNAQMGRSLDAGHVLALSLWDDVDVNMLWLDSAWPLDKNATQPGVRRGKCPGGESSTPTYVRKNFPDGYVTFANVAIGEIGSTMRPSTPTPTPAPPCLSGCAPRPNVQEPECSGQSEDRCKQMMQYEKKCRLLPPCNPAPTPAPTPSSTPAPTPAPAPSPTTPAPPTGCEKFCSLQNLTVARKGCAFLRMFPKLCAKAYVTAPGGQAKPCKWTGSRCRSDKRRELQCPNLEKVCAALAAAESPAEKPAKSNGFLSR